MHDIVSRLADHLQYGWPSLARKTQLPPPGDWTIWAIIAGRGAGKTRSGAEWVKSLAESGEGTRMGIIGSTVADVRDICVDGESGILAISNDQCRPVHEPSKRRLSWPNGAVASLFSSEEPERLRGQQFTHVWMDELGAWQNQQATFDQAMFGLRLGERPRCCVTTTPRPTPLLKDLFARAASGTDVKIVRESSYANRKNLPAAFFAEIVRRYEGARLGRQELEAELLADTPGALWSLAMIEELRVAKSAVPEFRRVIVAIDPATSCHETSDESGIIVAAHGVDGHGYVLADLSGRYQPNEWAKKAIGAYHRFGCDRIVAEINQGGAMVESTIRSVDANVPFRGINASRGKLVRAEPVSSLYEQGRIHHVGCFPQLEDQMTSYAGGGSSPDRLDALVYACTELMASKKSTSIIAYYRQLCEDDKANGGLPARPQLEATNVCLVAPGDISTLFTLSGRKIDVGADRLVLVSERDAISLKQAGWMEASVNA